MSDLNDKLRNKAFEQWHKLRRHLDRMDARLAWEAGYVAGRRATPAPQAAPSDNSNSAKHALHIMSQAYAMGWREGVDEGAWEFVTRTSYETGWKDAVERHAAPAPVSAAPAAGDDERAKFEAWHRSKFATKHSTGQPTRDMHNGIYAEKYGPQDQQQMWEAWQARASLPPSAGAPVSAVAGDEYSRNLLESCANWLESRSNTVWATENDSTSLMRSYAADLRMIRASLPSAGAPECDGCDPAEGFCKVCREREKSAGAPVSRKNEDPNWMGKIPHAFNSPAPVSEAEQAELDPNDLRIETYSPTQRPSWTAHTDRGIRITHIPTGVTVSEHEDRSQHRNKAVALEKLRALVAATPADAQELPALFTETDYRMLHSVAAYMALNDSSPRCAADLRSLAERIRAALATAMRQPQGDDWQPLTKAGQIQKGDKLRFTCGGKEYTETARLILEPGTDKEEVVYNIRQNFYFITSMAIKGTSSHKGVQVLAAKQAGKKGA